jgi:hypothetical protein
MLKACFTWVFKNLVFFASCKTDRKIPNCPSVFSKNGSFFWCPCKLGLR